MLMGSSRAFAQANQLGCDAPVKNVFPVQRQQSFRHVAHQVERRLGRYLGKGFHIRQTRIGGVFGDDESKRPRLSYFINAQEPLVGLFHDGEGADDEFRIPAEDAGFFRGNHPQHDGSKVGFQGSCENLLGAFGSDKLDIFQLGKERGNLVHGKGIVGRHGKERWNSIDSHSTLNSPTEATL